MVTLATIFSWFETGDFPTEQQFRDTFSSFWHKSEKIPYSQVSDGYNAVTDLYNFPVDKSLVVATIQADTSFQPAGDEMINHMTFIVKNPAAVTLKVLFPANDSRYVLWDGSVIEIPGGGLAEINVVKADAYYVMFKVKQ